MPEKDQERVEDYLELERYITSLQVEQATHLPERLTPRQARIYRMVLLFRTLLPEGTSPRPTFVASLQARLERERQRSLACSSFLFEGRKGERKTFALSRRALLAAAGGVVASFALGAGIEVGLEQRDSQRANREPGITNGNISRTPPGNTPLVDGSTSWHLITALARLGEEPRRFTTDTIVGYVLREYGSEGIIALSAACTHLGCLVQWQADDQKFHCPCHNGVFTRKGAVDAESSLLYLSPLPRLQTGIEQGNIYVRVPSSPH